MTSFFRSWILFPACVLTLVAGACAKPSVQEQFVRSDEARMGVYAFELDLDSSSRSYDIYLYSSTVLDTLLDEVRLDVQWISPSGEAASETVYLRDVCKRGVKELYRSGVEPEERGVWRLRVKVYDPGGDLTGLGIICESYGTRQT